MGDVPGTVLAIGFFISLVAIGFTIHVMVTVLQACYAVMGYIKRRDAEDRGKGTHTP